MDYGRNIEQPLFGCARSTESIDLTDLCEQWLLEEREENQNYFPEDSLPASFPYSSSAQFAPPLFSPVPHSQPAPQRSFSDPQKQEPVFVKDEPEPLNLLHPETQRFEESGEEITKDLSAKKQHRRERNREHSKRSRVRKKFLIESLDRSVSALKAENENLREAIHEHLGKDGDKVLTEIEKGERKKGGSAAGQPLLTEESDKPHHVTKLEDPDYVLVKALQTGQQNFLITDPNLPDNPIVFASQGFLDLTGYPADQILGRNCRFLQGPDTDPQAVDEIRKAIEEGRDCSVCLLNYTADRTPFWNQFFLAPLRGADGTIVNFVGVQCKVSESYAQHLREIKGERKQQKALGSSAIQV